LVLAASAGGFLSVFAGGSWAKADLSKRLRKTAEISQGFLHHRDPMPLTPALSLGGREGSWLMMFDS